MADKEKSSGGFTALGCTDKELYGEMPVGVADESESKDKINYPTVYLRNIGGLDLSVGDSKTAEIQFNVKERKEETTDEGPKVSYEIEITGIKPGKSVSTPATSEDDSADTDIEKGLSEAETKTASKS